MEKSTWLAFKRQGWALKLVFYWVIVVSFSACGGSNTNTDPPSNSPNQPLSEFRLVGTPPATIQQGQVYQFSPQVENTSSGVVFNIENKPLWTNFDIASGLLTGTPGVTDVGITEGITISANNGTSNASLGPFSIEVTAAGAAIILSTPPTDATSGMLYQYQLVIANPTPNQSLIFSLITAPIGMTISDRGLIQWLAFAGTHQVKVSVNNSNQSIGSSQEFSILVTNDSTDFAITSIPVTEATPGVEYRYQLLVNGLSPDVRVEHGLRNSPPGMMINTESGLITWLPTLLQTGTFQIVATATLGIESTSQSFTVTVSGANLEPLITSTPPLLATQGSLYQYALQAVDPDLEGQLSYILINSPQGMSINGAGLIEWLPPTIGDAVRTEEIVLQVIDTGNPPKITEQRFKLRILPALKILPKTSWKLVSTDSEETLREDSSAKNAFDGNPATFWHTKWSSTTLTPPPHEIIIDLAGLYELNAIRYLPRQDLNNNGRIKDYELYASEDAKTWAQPISAGSFSNESTPKEVHFPQIIARYIRLVALNDVHDTPHTAMAELDLVGREFTGNYPPNSIIESPQNDIEISPNQELVLKGSGLDRDSNGQFSYAWKIDNSFGEFQIKEPGPIKFTYPGTYTITLIVTDSLGQADPTPEKRIIKVFEKSNATLIPQTAWRPIFVNSEDIPNLSGNALDGNSDTFYRTSDSKPSTVHEIQIDLGSAYAIDALRYMPRQDGILSDTIKDYRIFISTDGLDWAEPVALGQFSNNSVEKRVLFKPTLGQFVRLVARSNVAKNIAIAEINIEGICRNPYIKLLSPRTNSLFSETQITITSSACLNSESSTPQQIKYVLDGQISLFTSTPPYTVTFNGLTHGEHTIEAYVVDANGSAIEGDHTYDIAESVGVGEYYVALGDSITAGIGDNNPSDNTSADGRDREGGFAPILNDLLTTIRNYPVRIAKEGLPGETSSTAIARLPYVIKRHPQAQSYLLLYGTNDANRSQPISSGIGLSPGDTGYLGSFKANMQTIINAIEAIGKKAFIAKIPYSRNSAAITTIEEYNQVIDELLVTNNIAIAAPDFFNHFQNAQDQLDNDSHPDGRGYKSMANLWLELLR